MPEAILATLRRRPGRRARIGLGLTAVLVVGSVGAATLVGSASNSPTAGHAHVSSSVPNRLLAGSQLDSQALHAWGANDWGQLGNGFSGNGSPSLNYLASIVPVPGGGVFSRVAGGGAHTLGLTAAGQLYAWGSNSSGQLGIGSSTGALTPQPVLLPPSPPTFIAIAAGSSFSMALTSTGVVYTWGSNFLGQLGNGATLGSQTPVLASTPPGVTFTDIAAGGDHALALSSTGQVYAWGANSYGQLGIGTQTPLSSTPTLVTAPQGVTFTAMAAGTSHSLALGSTGQVYSWGLDASGQLGDGFTVDQPSPVMVNVLLPATVTSIAAGSSHSMALTSSGQVYTWGSDVFGQLGSSAGQDSTIPLLPQGLPPLFTFVSIVGGSNSSYALASNGTLWVWGGNASGQAGVYEAPPSLNTVVPQTIAGLPPGTLGTGVFSGPDASTAFLVSRATQNITFPALPTPTYGDPPVNVAPSADSGLPVATSASGACAGPAGRLFLIGAGTCTIVATQSGNFPYYPATTTVTFPVAQATLTINPQNVTTTVGVPVASYPYQLKGFKNQDGTSAVSGSASCTSTASNPPFAGTFPITCTQGSLSSANYNFVVGPPATLTVVGPSSDYASVGRDGSVSAHAASTPPFYGSMAGHLLNAPVVGGVFAPLHDGYWLAASDGGIFAFGSAGFFGSMGGKHLNLPIVGITSTADGQGYWEVAADGGIFSFGDAAFYGSTGGQHINRPMVGMAATPDGRGYWLVAADGGLFAYGDAGFYGSTGGLAIGQPVVGMATTPGGNGYWIVTSGGLVFNFGAASFQGSLRYIPLAAPIAGIAATGDGGGYWLAGTDGGIFAFGDAGYYGRAPTPPGGVAGVM